MTSFFFCAPRKFIRCPLQIEHNTNKQREGRMNKMCRARSKRKRVIDNHIDGRWVVLVALVTPATNGDEQTVTG